MKENKNNLLMEISDLLTELETKTEYINMLNNYNLIEIEQGITTSKEFKNNLLTTTMYNRLFLNSNLQAELLNSLLKIENTIQEMTL